MAFDDVYRTEGSSSSPSKRPTRRGSDYTNGRLPPSRGCVIHAVNTGCGTGRSMEERTGERMAAHRNNMNRVWSSSLLVLVALVVVVAPAAAPDPKPPRIVAAAVLDIDGDSRADRVRLTYSQLVNHLLDRGRPLPVCCFRLPDCSVASVRKGCRHLPARARTARSGRDAGDPLPAHTTPAGEGPGPKPGRRAAVRKDEATPTPPAAVPPTPLDADGDGTLDADDCAPKDASIHPGAADVPDTAFVDSNCDRIDGTEPTQSSSPRPETTPTRARRRGRT